MPVIWSDSDATRLAMPRSMILAWRRPPGVSRSMMLSGDRSRWTMPCAWISARAREDLPRDVEGAVGRQGPAALEPALERHAVDELPHHVEGPVGLARKVVERGHVRVAHERGQARLLLEPARLRGGPGGIRLGDLDDPDFVEVQVARAVDLAHPALADLVEDLVLAVEHFSRREARQAEPAGGAEAGRGRQGGGAARAGPLGRRHGRSF